MCVLSKTVDRAGVSSPCHSGGNSGIESVWGGGAMGAQVPLRL